MGPPVSSTPVPVPVPAPAAPGAFAAPAVPATFPAPSATGYQVTLSNAGPYRGRVIVALRQLLGLDGPSAGRFVAAAPAVLAVGLSQEMAERLRATLVGAGAMVQVVGPPEPVETARQAAAPKPEPKRSTAETALVISQRPPRRGPRTLTGLALGRGGSYLAYGRAEGSRLLAPPDFIRLDSRSMIPTAVRLAGGGSTELCGSRALANWVQDPAEVSLGFTEELGLDDGAALAPTRAFLKFLNYRLVEVLGPGAADAADGAATTLALSCGRSERQARQLAEVAGQAGFPVVQVVPEPLAAVASYLNRDSAQPQHFLVIDWGSQGLDLAVVEDATVIDHVEYPLGGIWFDMILEGWLAERLPGALSDEDRRALTLFARQFKEGASAAFAEGRPEHVQYCVLPVGLPPTRISIARDELETLFHDSRAQFESAVAEAPARVGFEAGHFDQVVMVGGAARCYFARDAVRTALGRTPMAAPNPEEAIARGLVVWGARS